MTAFSVRQKQERSPTNPAVAYIRYIEINVNGIQYRLLKKASLFAKLIPFTVNGVSRTAPYSETTGINIVLNGGKLVFGATFGLTITWDGSNAATESLCDAYSTYVCGLCGNADGDYKY